MQKRFCSLCEGTTWIEISPELPSGPCPICRDPEKTCQCSDCLEADRPCNFDCGPENTCKDCAEYKEGVEEIQHEIDCARGLK